MEQVQEGLESGGGWVSHSALHFCGKRHKDASSRHLTSSRLWEGACEGGCLEKAQERLKQGCPHFVSSDSFL